MLHGQLRVGITESVTYEQTLGIDEVASKANIWDKRNPTGGNFWSLQLKCDGVTRRKETGGEKETGDQRQTTVDTPPFL